MSETYLMHFGIPGMHWGKKNGPPYPLDFNKLSAEEKEKAKAESIRKGDVITSDRNRDHYTDQEVREVIARFELNAKMSQLRQSTVKTGEQKVKELSSKLNTVGDLMNSGYKIAEAANKFAKLIKGDTSKDSGTKIEKTIDKIKGEMKVTTTYSNGEKVTITDLTKEELKRLKKQKSKDIMGDHLNQRNGKNRNNNDDD